MFLLLEIKWPNDPFFKSGWNYCVIRYIKAPFRMSLEAESLPFFHVFQF